MSKPFIKATTLDEHDLNVILLLAKNNMKISEEAHELDRNRNGILYRIEKINRITGLNPMKFYDLCVLVGIAAQRMGGEYE